MGFKSIFLAVLALFSICISLLFLYERGNLAGSGSASLVGVDSQESTATKNISSSQSSEPTSPAMDIVDGEPVPNEEKQAYAALSHEDRDIYDSLVEERQAYEKLNKKVDQAFQEFEAIQLDLVAKDDAAEEAIARLRQQYDN